MGSKISNRAGDSELVFAGCGLGGGTRDLLLKDTGMARFVVANLNDSLIGMWRVAGVFKNRLVKGLYTELIKGKDGPFCTKEILKEEVVGPSGAIACGKDWLRVIARKGRRGAIFIGVVGRLARDWSDPGVDENLARA